MYRTGGQCGQLGTAQTFSSVDKCSLISLWLPGVWPLCFSKTKYLWSPVHWEDKLQHMIRSFQILPPIFHSPLIGYHVCSHTFSPLSTLFANPKGYFVLLVISLHLQLSCFTLCPFLHPSLFSWSIMEVQRFSLMLMGTEMNKRTSWGTIGFHNHETR